MDGLFQKFKTVNFFNQILVLQIEKIWKFVNFLICTITKNFNKKIQKISNLKNSENWEFEKFEKFSIWKIRRI